MAACLIFTFSATLSVETNTILFVERIKEKGFDLKGETCNEETLLYQAVSGLHASINMHIASNYFDSEKNTSYKNHSMYINSLGTHPDRLKNLHFLYALVVRAVSRIHD